MAQQMGGNFGGGMPNLSSSDLGGSLGGDLSGGSNIKKKIRYIMIIIGLLTLIFGAIGFLKSINYILPFDLPMTDQFLYGLIGILAIITGIYSMISAIMQKLNNLDI